jgi:hypothetical protein
MNMLDQDEQSIMDMVDREAIRNVVIAYYDAIWRDDIETVVQLFAPDGTMSVVNGALGGNVPVGHEQLRDFYTKGVKIMTPRPFSHNHVVELFGKGQASGRSYVELRSSIDLSWVAAVIYEDEYIKIGRAWKLQSRRAALQNVK